jgi:hypothetical protein
MILANMIIGTMDIFIGFIILIIVIIIEGLFISKGLTGRFLESKIFISVFAANIATTLLGLIGILSWLWSIVVDLIKVVLGLTRDFDGQYFVIGFFILAFILTVPIEIIVNNLILKSQYKSKDINRLTFYSNLMTYLTLGIITLQLTTGQ